MGPRDRPAHRPRMGGGVVTATIRPLVGGSEISIEVSTPDELIRDYVDRAVDRAGGDRGEILWLLAAEIGHYQRRLNTIAEIVADLRKEDIETGGPVVYGETFVKVGHDTTIKIIDPKGLVDWLGSVEMALDLEPGSLVTQIWRLDSSNLRITTLREVAERMYRHLEPNDDDPDAPATFASGVVDTFLEIRRGDDAPAKLKEIPIEKAPKYVQRLGHGDRVGSFRNGGKGGTQ